MSRFIYFVLGVILWLCIFALAWIAFLALALLALIVSIPAFAIAAIVIAWTLSDV